MFGNPEFVRKHFSLTEFSPGVWVALNMNTDGSVRASFQGDRDSVIRDARRHWGHFNFSREAEAFGEIFPPSYA